MHDDGGGSQSTVAEEVPCRFGERVSDLASGRMLTWQGNGTEALLRFLMLF